MDTVSRIIWGLKRPGAWGLSCLRNVVLMQVFQPMAAQFSFENFAVIGWKAFINIMLHFVALVKGFRH